MTPWLLLCLLRVAGTLTRRWNTLGRSETLVSDDDLILALVESPSVAEAARVAGVSRSTLYRRFDDISFTMALSNARDAVRQSRLSQLSQAVGTALDALAEIAGNADVAPAVRVKAATALLQRME